MVGRIGRVSGTVGPGLVGEVMVAIRGGVEAFYATAYEPADTIPVGTTVLILEYHPPRDVVVARAQR